VATKINRKNEERKKKKDKRGKGKRRGGIIYITQFKEGRKEKEKGGGQR